MAADLSKAIKNPKTFLQWTGIWPRSKSTLFYKTRGFLCDLVTVLFPITMFMELSKHLDDYGALFTHLTVTLPPTSYLIKRFVVKFKENELLGLLPRLDSKHFNRYPESYGKELKKSIDNVGLVAKFFWYFCGTVISLYALSPVLISELPVKFSYDLGSYKFLMYIFQVIGLANAASNNSCLDVLAASFMTITSGQINVLNKKIMNFKRYPDGTEKSEKAAEEYLRECVKHHNEIIEFLEILQNIFSIIFLVQYLTSGIEICYIGFQLVHVHPISVEFSKMLFFLVSMLCQLGMYCWFGNEIVLESTATRSACYESEWTQCSPKTRKLLFIIMERSKKPLFLTAGKFSVLSLASFTSVINTSYSYFALMQRMYKDQSK